MIITDQFSEEIVIEDVNTDDADDVLFVLDDARDLAADIRADVDIQILSTHDDTVTLEVTGDLDDMGPFMRAWSERP